MNINEIITPEQAQELFHDSGKVLMFLSEQKWKNGFRCRKCNHTNYCEGKTPYSRRCTRCKAEESAMAHTIFHNVKFPVNKAFYMVYNVCANDRKLSSYCFADELGLNQMTCWKFRKRIETCLEKRNDLPPASRICGILLDYD